MKKVSTEGPKQKTQPKKGEPVEIPVPKRSAFDRLISKAEKKPKT